VVYVDGIIAQEAGFVKRLPGKMAKISDRV